MTWHADLRDRPIAEVAPVLGLLPRRSGSWGPCPACRAEDRGDSRGPIGLAASGRGWRCMRCSVSGGAIELAAWVAVGSVPERSDRAAWARVGAACAGWGLAPSWDGPAGVRSPERPAPVHGAVLRPRVRPPPGEVRAWWGSLSRSPEVDAWVRSRGSDPERLDVRTSRGPWPAWVPGWAQRGRPAVFPLYSADGEISSVRLRAIGPCRGPKATGPSGRCDARTGGEPYSTVGCVLANPTALAGSTRTWLIVEGEPDWMAWASRRPDVAILGIGSGWFDASWAARIPADAVVCVATHADAAGAEYARRIEAALPGRVVGYAPPPRGGDWADWAARGSR